MRRRGLQELQLRFKLGWLLGRAHRSVIIAAASNQPLRHVNPGRTAFEPETARVIASRAALSRDLSAVNSVPVRLRQHENCAP